MELRPEPMQPRRYYDGGVNELPSPQPGEPPLRPHEAPNPDAEPQILLRRVLNDGVEEFGLQRRIAYLDDEYGELLVPSDVDSFLTDLTSVPALFTWLVPKSGHHLPAALVHDGLIHSPGQPTYVSTDGHVIDRVGADRVFRSAMRDSGTGFVRRWLVWSAVTLGTIWHGSVEWSTARHWRYRTAMIATLLLVAVLGVFATLDLFDRGGVTLPWMGKEGWWLELAGGMAGAIVFPLVLGAAWGRFYIAGAITGIALALLLHVSVLLGAISLVYLAAEWLARRRPLALTVAGGIVVAACIVLVLALWVWT